MATYYRLAQLPLSLRFDIRKAHFKKTAFPGTADTKPTYDSSVEVTVTIGNTTYGRLSTGIHTFRHIWEGRKAARQSADSKALIRQLADYHFLLESTYEALLKADRFVDGQVLMNAVREDDALGQRQTLAHLYAEFIVAKKASIEPNQRKRSYDQISPTTFRSYPKRWAMIQLFLTHSKRSQLPVSAIDYALVTRFKEFLVAYQKGNKPYYSSATINKAISFLKMLMTYAQSKGYVAANPIRTFACRGGSPANPKPLTEEQLSQLETCPLPAKLRHICDSWLIAGELCLHYADYMRLPAMQFISQPDGRRYIQHERSKQQGSSLKQTVNITPRAERLLAKYGGPAGLYFKSSGAFSSALKLIAYRADLIDSKGEYVKLQFGMGRDTGLTSRARSGANGIQLSKMAGWSNPREARRYLGDDLGIVEGFARNI